MSLDKAAKYLEAHGRNGDSMLVHMSPKEVQSLQSLAMAHGGSLSINPHTGLAEAGFLKNLLPTLAGIGLSFIPGVGPLAAAGMVGGFETLRTGDIGKGLMAGLGAYGGAGLTSSLASAGAAATEGASGAINASPIAENVAERSANIKDLFNVQTATPIPGAELPGSAAGQTVASTATPQAPVNLANVGKGIGQLGSETGRSAVYSAMDKGTIAGLGSSAVGALTPEAPKPPGPAEEDEMYKTSPYRYKLASNFGGYTPNQPNPYYRPTGLGYAGGGDIDLARGGYYDDSFGQDNYASGGVPKEPKKPKRTPQATINQLDPYQAALAQLDNERAEANLRTGISEIPSRFNELGTIKVASGGQLGGYSDGGRMLRGPGDGMSDSIPATISGKQPARLADGEFVVPADVVSHLGNGSTDAGAKKLYAMMDKVRTARTGTKKQGKQINANKFLPKG